MLAEKLWEFGILSSVVFIFNILLEVCIQPTSTGTYWIWAFIMKLRIRYLLTMRYKIAGLWAFVSSFDFRPTLLGISEWMGSSAVLCYLYGKNTTHCLVLGQNAKGASCRKVDDWWIVVQAAFCPWRGGSVGCWRGQQEGERTGQQQQQQRHLCHHRHAHFQHTGDPLPPTPNL